MLQDKSLLFIFFLPSGLGQKNAYKFLPSWAAHPGDRGRQQSQATDWQGKPTSSYSLASTAASHSLDYIQKKEVDGAEEEVQRRGEWWARLEY